MLRDEDPRGTVSELEEKGVDLKRFGSCSRRIKDDNGKLAVRGCWARNECQLLEKVGKGPKTSGKDGAGPCRKGLLVIKKLPDGTSKPTRVVMDCFHIPGFVKRVENPDGVGNKGHVRVIASEGEFIEVMGTTKRADGTWSEPVMMKEEVRKFPRPGQPGNLQGQDIVVEELERARAENRRTLPAKLLGVTEESDAEAQA